MKAHLTQLLATAAKTIAPDFEATILLERPKSAEHGDFATNLALVLAKPLKQNPRAIAQKIIDSINPQEKKQFSQIEIAGPGFINFRILPTAYAARVAGLIRDERLGVAQFYDGLEFLRRLVRELAGLGAPVEKLVPPAVIAPLLERFGRPTSEAGPRKRRRGR